MLTRKDDKKKVLYECVNNVLKGSNIKKCGKSLTSDKCGMDTGKDIKYYEKKINQLFINYENYRVILNLALKDKDERKKVKKVEKEEKE